MSLSKDSKKRKVDDRDFQEEWKEKYLFVSGPSGKPVCLMCGFSVSVVKKYNVERHYTSNHADIAEQYPIGSDLRSSLISRKEKSLTGQQSVFVRIKDHNKSTLIASYEMAFLLAKKKKPFTDGEEIIKPALEIAAKMIGDKQVSEKLNQLTLSNNTMTRRVGELANDVHRQVAQQIQNCKYFSLAIDESTDISDTAQLAVFIRSVSDDFEVIEELLELESIHETTKGSDLFETLKLCADRKNIDWSKLDSVCSDGAPALTGKQSGCLALLEKFLCRPILKYHCIIHQEALCGKTLNLKHVMDVVVKCVNKIRGRALNRREFRVFLNILQEEYGELLFHCDVRWLSRGKLLSRFWELKESAYLFLSEIDDLPTERECIVCDDWLNDLAFLVDITSHLNKLNVSLQGKEKLFTNLCDDISAFKMKLQLFVGQLEAGTLTNFPTLQTRSAEHVINLEQYKDKLQSLLDAFRARFGEFETEQHNVMLFTNPFVFPDDKLCSLEPNLQQEVIDVKCSSVLRSKFMEIPASPNSKDMIQFWSMLPAETFPHLRSFAQRYICRFGTTYRCEQSFSTMKLIKNKQRSRLTDDNLSALMTLAVTDMNPDIDRLASEHM